MPKDPQLRIVLRGWFSNQSKYSSLRDMSNASAIPFNTLRGYFSGKRPTEKNLKKLAEATGLELSLSPKSSQSNTEATNTQDENKRSYAAQLLGDLHYDLTRCLWSLVSAGRLIHWQRGHRIHTSLVPAAFNHRSHAASFTALPHQSRGCLRSIEEGRRRDREEGCRRSLVCNLVGPCPLLPSSSFGLQLPL